MSEIERDDDWEIVQQLFHEVADLDEKAQSSFWDKGNHSSAIRAIVESLLEHDRAMPRLGFSESTGSEGSSLSLVPGPASIPSDSSEISGRLLFSPGATIDGVELLYPVAQTASSEVWCGQQVDGRQRVAVKFLRFSDSTSIQKERFAREVEVLKRLKHPNIAAVLDAGSTEPGNPYFVMQWVDGTPVTEFCDQQQLTIRQRVNLVRSLCEAIEYANKFLIVHRDLKPDNVLVRDDGFVSVLDFGIAKILSPDERKDSIQLTQKHERLLTPAYAAPEQNRGDAITTATDVHGIGVILFELLCGHHPFSDPAQTDKAELYDRVCSGVPIPPSQLVSLESVAIAANGSGAKDRKNPQLLAGYRDSTPAKLRKVLKGKLDLICAAALEKDPSLRIARASDLRDELLNWEENRPLKLQSSSPSISAWMHRHPGRFAAICSMLATLIVGSVITWLMNARNAESVSGVERLESEIRKAELELGATRKTVDQVQEKNDALNQTLSQVVGSSGSPNEGRNLNGSGKLPVKLAIQSAHSLATQKNYDGARKLIAGFGSQVPKELEDRILLAGTLGKLGHTTRALNLLTDVTDSPSERYSAMPQKQRVLASQTLARLLLDAGWVREAANHKDRQFSLEDPQRNDIENRDLLDIELLVALQEFGFADERLSEFDGMDRASLMTSDQRMQRLLLKIAIAHGQEEADLAAKQIEALPESYYSDPIRKIQLLRLKASMESAAEAKVVLLQEALEHLAQSELPDHSIGVRLVAEIAEAVEDGADSQRQVLWLNKAWKRISELQELGLSESCDILAVRADAVGSQDEIDSVLSDSVLIEPYRKLLLAKLPWQQRSYSATLLDLALNPDSLDQPNETQQAIVCREVDHLLTALEGVTDSTGIDVAYANAAFLECQTTLDPVQIEDVESKILNSINEELSRQQQPVRVFLLAAKEILEGNGTGRPVSWISLYQKYRGVEPENQREMIVYSAEDAMSLERQESAEWLLSQYLKSFAQPDNLELQMRALKVIAGVAERSEETTALFTKTLGRLKDCDDDKLKDELPGIEVTSAFNLGDADAIGLAKKLLKKHPNSTSLKTSIWHIKEKLKEADDARLKDWQTVN